jgi:hypothetical protein
MATLDKGWQSVRRSRRGLMTSHSLPPWPFRGRVIWRVVSLIVLHETGLGNNEPATVIPNRKGRPVIHGRF